MSKIDNLKWCSNCLSMSTRPRISFDQRVFVMHVGGWKKKLLTGIGALMNLITY